MTKHVIHENEVEAKSLPGRDHKMIVSPWHFGQSQNMCFGLADFPPNSHAPGHVHATQEEIIYIISGFGEMFFDGEPEPIEPGSIVYIPSNVVHSIKNDADEVMKLVYVFSPPVEQGSYDKK